ncbi:MAG: Ig-like domain-containing protein, partial [Lachnospiraceae bacterium]|nr:Ig-like domain-containing protein [Lachnospiraceae bacterium]
ADEDYKVTVVNDGTTTAIYVNDKKALSVKEELKSSSGVVILMSDKKDVAFDDLAAVPQQAIDDTDHVYVTKVEAKPVTVTVGAKVSIDATITPATATDKQLFFESANPEVAAVDANGVVTGVKSGTATIKVYSAEAVEPAVVSVVVSDKTEAVAAPVIKVAKAGSKKVKVSWSAVKGATSFEVYTAGSAKGAFKKVATVKTTTYTVNVTNGKVAYFKVIAVSADGKVKSVFSNTAGICIPAKVNFTKASLAGKKKVKLTWKKVAGATGYKIYRKVGKGKFKAIATVKGAKKVTFTDKKSLKKGTYTYKIVAYATIGKVTATSADSKSRKVKIK